MLLRYVSPEMRHYNGVINCVLMLFTNVTTLAGPCEASQQLVSAAGRRWALLLSLERRHPALAAEAGLQREEAGRQLETIGELGLFRLRRSTLLSLVSTVLTYIIVVAQFQSAEIPTASAAANSTASRG
ncbi:hypothetical protein FJT64_012831 [Amphibalanus amphitrite]|uniref:Uncharacterized protein n=1 Tax=Amphibalanus amphitrite TaxID=1232801 RepID=A0A6A4VEG4_AMPAM|nr:hypothetical protein FJT64_012831 [Amphibalanus amphitrite]